MTQFTPLLMLLLVCLASITPGHAAEPEKELHPMIPFEIRDAEKPDEKELLIFAKLFCTEMRKYGENTLAYREFIDPQYLEKHDLRKGDLPIETAPIRPIFDIKVADDMQTILCIVGTTDTQEGKNVTREALLLRITVHQGKLYLLPEEAPDAKTNSFTPWILRMKV